MPYYLGIDLGGTNIKAGVIDAHGSLLNKLSTPTNAPAGPDVVIDTMINAAHDAASDAGVNMTDIDAIGIGSPGPIDFDHGVIVGAPNLSGFVNVPLRDRIRDATGRPTVLENDANAAAYGEYFAGAARDKTVRNVVMLTLGTGIGSGLIVDGRVLHGGFGYGGEGGHMIVVPDGRPCGCGQKGCLETYASASRTAQRAQEAVEHDPDGPDSAPAQITGPITSRKVFNAAIAGDAVATRIVDHTCMYLGLACVNLCRLLDPQMILFAGGMINAGEFLFSRIRSTFKRYTWRIAADRVVITAATLGDDAGVIGAAAVAADARQTGQLH